MFIHDICNTFNSKKIPYAIVGGYAVALHGAVRGTLDIDIAIVWTLENLKKVEKSLNQLGLISSLPIDSDSVFHFKNEYIEKRHLVAWRFYDPKNAASQVDIIINYDLKDAHIEIISTSFGNIKVLSKKDLIEMKKAFGRPQDLEDVKALESI